MRVMTIVYGGLLACVAGSALACDLPKLVVIPPKDQVAGKEAEIRAAASTYFTAMQAYTQCVQAELEAAGGESAPALVRQVLIARNNTAVAEAEFVMKLFTSSVGGTEPAPPAASP